MPQYASLSRRHFLATTAAVSGSLLAKQGRAADDSKPQQKLIDCHLHVNHLRRGVEETIAHIDATGTTKAFILPIQSGGSGGVVYSSDSVVEIAERYPDHIIPFCQVGVLEANVLERIRHYYELGCRGIGEQKERVPLNDKRLEGVIALCDELNWPITLHFQDGPNGYNMGIEEHLEPLLKKYKRVRILAHAQSWWSHISADVPAPEKTLYPTGPVKPGGLMDHLLSNYPNLYADMSAGSGYNALTRDEDFTAGFLERHRKQILFGSDCPCWDGNGENFRGTCYSMQLQAFLRRMISDPEALDDVFYNNAMRALNGTA